MSRHLFRPKLVGRIDVEAHAQGIDDDDNVHHAPKPRFPITREVSVGRFHTETPPGPLVHQHVELKAGDEPHRTSRSVESSVLSESSVVQLGDQGLVIML